MGLIFLLLIILIDYINSIDDLLFNWNSLLVREIPEFHLDSRENQILTVIGGFSSTGIERITKYISDTKGLNLIELGSNYWNLTSHQFDSSNVLKHISDSILADKKIVIIDDTGFDFLLELTSLLKNFKSINYFLITTEPEIFLSIIQKERISYCGPQSRLSSNKLNVK